MSDAARLNADAGRQAHLSAGPPALQAPRAAAADLPFPIVLQEDDAIPVVAVMSQQAEVEAWGIGGASESKDQFVPQRLANREAKLPRALDEDGSRIHQEHGRNMSGAAGAIGSFDGNHAGGGYDRNRAARSPERCIPDPTPSAKVSPHDLCRIFRALLM